MRILPLIRGKWHFHNQVIKLTFQERVLNVLTIYNLSKLDANREQETYYLGLYYRYSGFIKIDALDLTKASYNVISFISTVLLNGEHLFSTKDFMIQRLVNKPLDATFTQ